MLLAALMAFLMNSLSRKLKSTSRDALLKKMWKSAWMLGPGEPLRAAVISQGMSEPPFPLSQALPPGQPGSAALCTHRCGAPAGHCWLCPPKEGKGRPLLLCSASLCWVLPETTAARGAGGPWGRRLSLQHLSLSLAPQNLAGLGWCIRKCFWGQP